MNNDIATLPNQSAAIAQWGMQREQLELLKRTLAKGTTDDEFALFMSTAQRLGLDPFAKQIFAVKRWDSKEGREVMAIQVSIDGHRVGAARSNELDGQEGPYWCGDDGVWRDVWLKDDAPRASKVLVYRKGSSRPYTGVASYASYVQTKKDGTPNSMWSRGPDFMLAKCAEALALRKAFPVELGGVHAPEEAGDVADAEYVEMKALPKAAAVTPQAQQGQPPPTKPQPPVKPEPPGMTEEQEINITEQLQAAKTEPELQAIVRARITTARFSDPDQRARLLAAYGAQLKTLRGATP